MSTTQLPEINPILTLSREPEASLWIIEMHNGEDNRLTHELINRALKPALDIVEIEWRESWRASEGKGKAGAGAKDGRGAVIIIGKRDQDKFFSNGLDFAKATKDPAFFPDTYNTLISRLLGFPIPVIAAINGHCFAGGLALALSCDYRVMVDGKKKNAWCCMNEVHFGAPLPTSLAAVIRTKVADSRTVRRIAMEGHRFTPQEALDTGIIDVIADGGTSDAVFASARALAVEKSLNAKTGVWGLIKKETYRHLLEDIALDYRTILAVHEDMAQAAKARL